MSTESSVILNITNAVVQTQTANALLAVGGSPIMSHCCDEIDEIIAFSRALNLNIGTLHPEQMSIFKQALMSAQNRQVPVSFDPVGFGATTLRNNTTLSLLQSFPVSVIKGNADEIIALAKQSTVSSNTIDSEAQSANALNAAKTISKRYQCVVAITGRTDFCIKENEVHEISGGHSLMSRVTGMGCIANAIIAFMLGKFSPIDAAVSGLTLMANAGELASKHAQGPQSFYTAFIDSLYQLSR